jgi:copper transport protein
VGVGGPAWRRLAEDRRAPLLADLVRRFSRLAVGAVAVVVVTGAVNSFLELATPGDLWRLDYGRAILAKIGLLAVALALAARHRWVVPGRLARPTPEGGAAAAVGSFERTSAWEAVLLGLAVAVTAGLVVLVPGRTVALAAAGPVNETSRTAGYTVQLYIDPTAVGANEFHVSFVTPSGLAAGEVTNASVSLGPVGSGGTPLAMRLISPGHFVGDGDLPGPGRYQLAVDASTDSAKPSTSFTFSLSTKKE